MKNYKTLITILFLLFLFSKAQSQEGYTYLNLSAGPSLDDAYSFKIAIENSTARYNGWEIYFEGYNRDHYKNWMGGLAYKKNVYRGRNLYSSLNIGAQGGTDESDFIGSVNAGIELGFFFSNNFAFFITNKNDYIFGAEEGFRHFLTAGFKIPL